MKRIIINPTGFFVELDDGRCMALSRLFNEIMSMEKICNEIKNKIEQEKKLRKEES